MTRGINQLIAVTTGEVIASRVQDSRNGDSFRGMNRPIMVHEEVDELDEQVPIAGPGCHMPCPGVPKVTAPVAFIVGTTSVASVSTTLPSDVNVARPCTGTGTEAIGVTGVRVNCQDPVRDGRLAA